MSTQQFDIADCQFSIPEGHRHLKISRAYFYKLVGAGKIKVVKLGGRTIVPGSELRRVVQAIAAGDF